MRLIDADALIAEYDKVHVGSAGGARKLMEDAPTIKPESNCSEFPNNWIPVDERFPEEEHWLGGSGKQFSENVLVSVLNSADEDEWVDVSHTIDGEWALELPSYCKIIAWMPLPEPWKGE